MLWLIGSGGPRAGVEWPPMARKRDVLRILEAAYPSEDGDAAWLARLSDAVRADSGIPSDGVFAQIYDASSGAGCDFGTAAGSGVSDDVLRDLFGRRIARYYNEHPELVRDSFRSMAFSLSGEIPGMNRHPELRAWLDQAGIGEVVGINASSPSGHGVIVCILVARRLRLADPTRRLFTRVASHIAAANRLRMRLASRGGVRSVDSADAVIDAAGRVTYAARGARVAEARSRIAQAASTLLRLRGRRRDDGERAAAAWKTLVDARWSLVDHFDHDGRQLLVAQRNDPEAPRAGALTVRERQVAALAALGRSNKEIAYELGITASTVGVLLGRAAARLGVRSRRALCDAVRGTPS